MITSIAATLLALSLFLLVGMARIEQSPTSVKRSPTWIADYLTRESVLPGGARLAPSEFPQISGVEVAVTSAADEGAETVDISALSAPIPAGARVKGGGFDLQVTRLAPAGATSLHVTPLAEAVPADTGLTFEGREDRFVPEATLVGRTFAERDERKGFGPADVAGDDEIYLLVHDVQDASKNADVDLLRHDRLLKENFIPGWEDRPAAEQTFIREHYQMTIGQA